MQQTIVFTFVGADRPGLVDALSSIVTRFDGNWRASRLCRLAGQFAGIVEITVDEKSAAALSDTLKGLAGEGLIITATSAEEAPSEPGRQTQTLHVLGLDRVGILRDVSRALAEADLNVTEMMTDVFPAPMSGDVMFAADAVVSVPENADLDALHDTLENISSRLDVEIDLGTEDE